jgi:hypothetical protein
VKEAAAHLLPPSRTFGRVVGRAWTVAERETLKALYVTKGLHACERALPGRSSHAICQAARRLGLRTHKRWTAEDDRIITSEWGFTSLEQIARRLGRTAKAVYQHARADLDVGMGAPEGAEYLTASARRTGFDVPTLRRVLAYAGVKPRRVPTRPTGRRVSHRMTYVDGLDVDDAVAAWMASEYVEPAAVARGISGEALARWLHEAGVPDKRTKCRERWRVPTATIDRVVAERKAIDARTESITGGAARHGLPAGTLRYWLVRAGVRLYGKPWRLDPAVVARVAAARRAVLAPAPSVSQ